MAILSAGAGDPPSLLPVPENDGETVLEDGFIAASVVVCVAECGLARFLVFMPISTLLFLLYGLYQFQCNKSTDPTLLLASYLINRFFCKLLTGYNKLASVFCSFLERHWLIFEHLRGTLLSCLLSKNIGFVFEF
jgi:hypothetical protein